MSFQASGGELTAIGMFVVNGLLDAMTNFGRLPSLELRQFFWLGKELELVIIPQSISLSFENHCRCGIRDAPHRQTAQACAASAQR